MALLALGVPATAHASAQELFGVGPRDIGMGGAATALGDHDGAVYYDPAAMADAPRLRFYLDGLEASPDVKIDGQRPRGLEPLRATSLGVVAPLPLRGALADRLAVGLLLHSPTDRLIRVYSLPPTVPQMVILGDDSQIVGFFGGLSVKLTKALAIGAAVRLSANVHADVAITTTDRSQVQETNGFLTSNATPLASLRFAPPGKSWRVALTWRKRFQEIFAVPARNVLGGLGAPTPGLKSTTLFVPMEVVAGGEFAPAGWTATLDVAWKKWSEFPDPTVVLGRLPTAVAPFPSFHDTIAARAGFEKRLPMAHAQELALRVGAGFEPSPVPEMKDDYNFMDADRAIAALGAGWAFPFHGSGHFRVDAGFQDQLLMSRTERKDPTKVPVGTVLVHKVSGSTTVGTLGVSWEY